LLWRFAALVMTGSSRRSNTMRAREIAAERFNATS